MKQLQKPVKIISNETQNSISICHFHQSAACMLLFFRQNAYSLNTVEVYQTMEKKMFGSRGQNFRVPPSSSASESFVEMSFNSPGNLGLEVELIISSEIFFSP